jgi:hypothetical protein
VALLYDWLGSIALPDRGLPFGLPIADPAGCAPFFVDVDPARSSLHMTSMLAAIAHRIARHDKSVRDHEWLATATEYSLRCIRELDGPGHALEFRFALQLLDTVHDLVPGADAELRRLVGFIPASGSMTVEGGIEGEAMHLRLAARRPRAAAGHRLGLDRVALQRQRAHGAGCWWPGRNTS